MARISAYGLDTSISREDLLVGTDAEDNNITKNFSVGDLSDFIGNKLGTPNTIPMFSATGLLDSKITQVVFDASTTAINVGTIPTKGEGTPEDPYWIDNFQVEGNLSASGNVAIGTPRELENQQFDLNILGEEGKIAFGDNNVFGNSAVGTPITWNVVVGEYGTGDTDVLQLHGKYGTRFTRGSLGTTDSMVIDAAGQVGINIPSPSETLEVGGNIKASGAIIDSGTGTRANLTLKSLGSAGYGGGGIIDIIGSTQDYVSYETYVKLSGGTTVASQVYDMNGDTWTWDGNMQSGFNTSTSYNFKSGGSSQMVIYNNNVGIGMTTPYFKLDVANGGIGVPWDSTGITFVNFQTVGSSIKSNTSSDLIFNTRLISAPYTESERMRILNNGNVGINVITPQSKLQVGGGIQMANDDAAPSATKVGTLRYRVSGNNSYVDMCMQTGATTYAWVNIVTNNW